MNLLCITDPCPFQVNDVLKIDSSRDEPETVEVDDEAAEVMAGFDRCFSTVGVFKLLETIPAEEVTPKVAVHALNTIISLENSSLLKKDKPPSEDYRAGLKGSQKMAGARLTTAINNGDREVILSNDA